MLFWIFLGIIFAKRKILLSLQHVFIVLDLKLTKVGLGGALFYAGKRALKFMRLWGNGDNTFVSLSDSCNLFPSWRNIFPSWVKIFPQLEATNFPVLRFSFLIKSVSLPD